MKCYLILLTVSNIFMLHVADLFLFLKCKKIADIIITQCNNNTEFIGRSLSNE